MQAQPHSFYPRLRGGHTQEHSEVPHLTRIPHVLTWDLHSPQPPLRFCCFKRHKKAHVSKHNTFAETQRRSPSSGHLFCKAWAGGPEMKFKLRRLARRSLEQDNYGLVSCPHALLLLCCIYILTEIPQRGIRPGGGCSLAPVVQPQVHFCRGAVNCTATGP